MQRIWKAEIQDINIHIYVYSSGMEMYYKWTENSERASTAE